MPNSDRQPEPGRPNGPPTPGQVAGSDSGPLADDTPQRALGTTVVLWLLSAALVSAIVFVVFGRLMSGDWNPWNDKTKPDLFELSRATVTVTGLLGAAVAAGIATRRQRSQEKAVEISKRTHLLASQTYAFELRRADAEVMRGLRERYGAAAGQLGSDAAATRLAGVYAMASLADDWLQRGENTTDARSCIDVLCAYLRVPKPDGGSDLAAAVAEREVRQTIVRLIAGHLQPDVTNSWSWCDFDFTGAEFSGDTSFAGSRFDGRISFAGAVFDGSRVSFERAHFARTAAQGKLSFDGAKFKCATALLSSSTFDRLVTFSNVTFGTKVDFSNSEFNAEARFVDCALTSACGVSLRGIEVASGVKIVFRDCELDGSPILNEAILRGGTVVFDHCQIRGELSLSGVTVTSAGAVLVTGASVVETGARISFRDASLESGRVSIDETTIEGGTVDFTAADFISAYLEVTPPHDRATFIGPWGDTFSDKWPESAPLPAKPNGGAS